MKRWTKEDIAARVARDIPRGGHLDICVLGAFQVAANGDLANWHSGAADAIPAVGGAMGLAIGARATWGMMEHTTKAGEPKLVACCSYPLTGLGCVQRVYTDLAVLDITPQGVQVREIAPGTSWTELQACTGLPLYPAPTQGAGASGRAAPTTEG